MDLGFGIATIAAGLGVTAMIQPTHAEWLTKRGLDPEIAADCGLHSVQREGRWWLAVPYRQNGETVNHKYRLTSEKDHRMDSGAPLLLWNADALLNPALRQSREQGGKPLIITEGEWDALAVIQGEMFNVVSVPAGAPSSVTENLDEAKRYEWVDRHQNELRQIKSFILATDNDQAGHYLRTDLVALLGADRCSFIEYPDGCKDLGDVLKHHGTEAVQSCLARAKPVPVQGLYQVDDFPERGEVQSFDIGIRPISDMIRVVPGTLTVLTGYSNMGKSTLMNAVIANSIANSRPVCVASFETDVKPILVEGIALSLLRCAKHELQRHPNYKSAMDTVRSGLSIISQNVDEDLEMDLDMFLELARLAVVRHSARMIVLDPWNEIEHKRRRDESETEYTGRAIRAIKRFAKQNNVAFWLVAHPSKPMKGHNGPPGLYDISGSANFANKADYGLIYHRPKLDENRALIRIPKVRMGLPGRRGEVAVSFDFRTSEFVEAIA